MIKFITCLMATISLSSAALAVVKKTSTNRGYLTHTLHEFDDGHKVRVTTVNGHAVSAGAKGPSNEHWTILDINDSKTLTSKKGLLKDTEVSVQVDANGGVSKTNTKSAKVPGLKTETKTEFSNNE